MHLLLVGMNHRTAGIDQREALAFSRDERLVALRALTGDGGCAEALIVTTCNRTEFYVAAADVAAADLRVREAVCRLRNADLLAPGPLRYAAADGDAVRHLFRVAAGLESMVLGEAQILGQIKEAVALAREANGDRAAARPAVRPRPEDRQARTSRDLGQRRRRLGGLRRDRTAALGAGVAGWAAGAGCRRWRDGAARGAAAGAGAGVAPADCQSHRDGRRRARRGGERHRHLARPASPTRSPAWTPSSARPGRRDSSSRPPRSPPRSAPATDSGW